MELPQRGLGPTASDNNNKLHQTVKRNEGAINQPRMLIIRLSSNYATVLKGKKKKKKKKKRKKENAIVFELLHSVGKN
jgi:hypothetical protein